MIVATRKTAGEVCGVELRAEDENDRRRLAVILSDLGHNKVPPAQAVVVRGAAVVTMRRQIFLHLLGCDAPRTVPQIAAALGLSPMTARSRLIELVRNGDAVRTGDDRFDVATRAEPPQRRVVGRPRGTGVVATGRPRSTVAKPEGAR
jgi:hypothetical protein